MIIHIEHGIHQVVFCELDYQLTGRLVAPQEHQMPQITLWIHLMDLTSDDKQDMQLDSKHVPTPTVIDRRSSSFSFPLGTELA